jgi:predicted transcriptional regulator of viral defense system
MTIHDRVLTVIASRPGGIGLQELRAELYDVSIAGVGNAVSNLCHQGAIERTRHGHYRVPAPKQARAAAVPVATGGFVQAPSLARLMAGR